VSAIPPAARRICVVLDIEKYSRRTATDHLVMQRQLRRVTEQAAENAELRWAKIDIEDKGDGLLLQLPPAIDEPRVLPRLVNGLCEALRQSNRRALSSRQMRLRMAITQGIQHPGVTGAVGESLITASRLVDSQAVRSELDAHPAASLAVIVSDDLYRDVIAQGYPGLDPGAFRQVEAIVEAKGFAMTAWVHVPAPVAGSLAPARPGGLDAATVRKLADAARAAALPAAGATAGSLIGAAVVLHDQHGQHAGDHPFADHPFADHPFADHPDAGGHHVFGVVGFGEGHGLHADAGADAAAVAADADADLAADDASHGPAHPQH
jgi:hypothetical protein